MQIIELTLIQRADVQIPDGIPELVSHFVDSLAFTWDPGTGTGNAEVTGSLSGGMGTSIGIGEACLTGM